MTLSVGEIVAIVGGIVTLLGIPVGIVWKQLNTKIETLEAGIKGVEKKMNMILMAFATALNKDEANKDIVKALFEAMKE